MVRYLDYCGSFGHLSGETNVSQSLFSLLTSDQRNQGLKPAAETPRHARIRDHDYFSLQRSSP